jgi:hypothetical protein
MRRITLTHRAAFVAIASTAGIASAQIGPDPALIDAVAKLEPGTSIEKNNSKFTLNRRDAGTKAADGWFRASSAGGGFSVMLPGPISDETILSEAEQGIHFENNILFTVTGTTRFMVSCGKQDRFEFPAEIVPQMVGMLGNSSREFKSKPFTNGAISGLEYSGITAKNAYFVGHMFLLGKQLCQVLVGSASPFDGITPEIRAVFLSVQQTVDPKDR